MTKKSLLKIIFFYSLVFIFLFNTLFFLSLPKITLADGGDCRCTGETTGRRTTSLGACCWSCKRITGSYQNVFWDGAEKPCDCLLMEKMGVGTMEEAIEGAAVTTNPEFLGSLNKCCESFGGKPVIWRGQNEFCACKCSNTNEYQSARTLGDCCNACSVSEGGNVLWNTDLLNPSHSSTTCEANCECADGSKKISGQPSECCIACSSHAEVKYEGSDFDCACQAHGQVFAEATTPEECCRTAARELRANINDLEVKIQGLDFPCGPEMLNPPEQPTKAPSYEQTVPRLQIPLPTLPSLTQFMPAKFVGEAPERYLIIPWIGQYIAAIYKYIIGITGILAAIIIVVAGVIWLTAGGSAERVSTAKNFIEGAIVGLAIALTSYLLLYAINPQLTEFEALKIRFIERVDLADPLSPHELFQENIDIGGTFPTVPGGTFDKSTLKDIDEECLHTNTPVDPRLENPLRQVATRFCQLRGTNNNWKIVGGGFREDDDAVKFYIRRCLFRTSCLITTSNPFREGTIITDSSGRKIPSDPRLQALGEMDSRGFPKHEAELIAALLPFVKEERSGHRAGLSFDAYCYLTDETRRQGHLKPFVPCQLLMEQAFKENGFCRLTNETWHFELNDLRQSRNCDPNWTIGQVQKSRNGPVLDYRSCSKYWDYSNERCQDR